jgi:hypothetical protein
MIRDGSSSITHLPANRQPMTVSAPLPIVYRRPSHFKILLMPSSRNHAAIVHSHDHHKRLVRQLASPLKLVPLTTAPEIYAE